jgi:LPPG:FO 2-phospho-L-lactate transferase
VRGFHFEGIESARPAPGVLEAINAADAVVICPSNPWVSIDPILAVIAPSMSSSRPLRVSVSPLIGGQAIKGPAAKMFTELGLEPNAVSVAQHYKGAGLDGIVLDSVDAAWSGPIRELGIQPYATATLMVTSADRLRLAQAVLDFVQRLSQS